MNYTCAFLKKKIFFFISHNKDSKSKTFICCLEKCCFDTFLMSIKFSGSSNGSGRRPSCIKENGSFLKLSKSGFVFFIAQWISLSTDTGLILEILFLSNTFFLLKKACHDNS